MKKKEYNNKKEWEDRFIKFLTDEHSWWEKLWLLPLCWITDPGDKKLRKRLKCIDLSYYDKL